MLAQLTATLGAPSEGLGCVERRINVWLVSAAKAVIGCSGKACIFERASLANKAGGGDLQASALAWAQREEPRGAAAVAGACLPSRKR